MLLRHSTTTSKAASSSFSPATGISTRRDIFSIASACNSSLWRSAPPRGGRRTSTITTTSTLPSSSIRNVSMQSASSSTTTMTIPPGDALVVVPGDGCESPAVWLAPFSAALNENRSVWLWFGDLPPSSPLPDAVLPALSAACSAAARLGKPTADFVPLVPRLAAMGEFGGGGGGEGAGVWRVLGGGGGGGGGGESGQNEDSAPPSSPSVSASPPPPLITSVLVGSEKQREEASALARRIEEAEKKRSDEGKTSSAVAVVVVGTPDPSAVGAAAPSSPSSFPVSLPRTPKATAETTETTETETAKAGAETPQSPPRPPAPLPPFAQVAVGGTFDRLHAGHRLLLAASAMAAERRLFVGVTSDKLLASKKHAELLQPYEERCKRAESFARRVRPDPLFRVDVAALCDPSEPTGAETDAAMEALVVSRETVSGGEAINEGRRRRGFGPLALLVVGLVGGGEGNDGDGDGNGDGNVNVRDKISSTELRAAEAAARVKERQRETEREGAQEK